MLFNSFFTLVGFDWLLGLNSTHQPWPPPHVMNPHVSKAHLTDVF